MAESPSNWDTAIRKIREQQLICPKCSAENIPRATIIELGADGVAFCGVCTHAWKPDA